MTDEHNSMRNRDAELGFSNDMTPLERLDEQGIRGAIIANNVRAFILHAVLVIISVPLVWGPFFAAVLALICYPYFTYRYFKPVARMNALSVVGVGVVLLVITAISYLLYLSDGLHTYFPAWVNLSGWLTMLTVSVFLFDYQYFGYQQMGAGEFVAALVPSALMYVGLCLKIDKEKREKKHGKRKRKQKLPPRIQ